VKKYKDFIPKDDAGYLQFLIAYKQFFPELKAITLPNEKPEEATAHLEEVQELIDLFYKVTTKKYEYHAIVEEKEIVKKKVTKSIRRYAGRSKLSPTAAPELIAKLELICKGYPVNEREISPKLRIVVVGSSVEVNFTKEHSYMVTVFCRVPGDDTWEHIGFALTSPFIDTRPLRVPHQPEKRMYMATFTDGVRQIGQQSSAHTVLFGG
jgi:hypothetical protein